MSITDVRKTLNEYSNDLINLRLKRNGDSERSSACKNFIFSVCHMA